MSPKPRSQPVFASQGARGRGPSYCEPSGPPPHGPPHAPGLAAHPSGDTDGHGEVGRLLGASLLAARGHRAAPPRQRRPPWRPCPGGRPTCGTAPRSPNRGSAASRRRGFIRPAPIRDLRDRTRSRKALLQDRTRKANRLHTVLADAGVRLAHVAADVLGVSGRAMLAALIEGTTDPAVLADLARGRLRARPAFLASQSLAHLD